MQLCMNDNFSRRSWRQHNGRYQFRIMEIDIGKRQQTLMVLWFAMLMNMGLLFVVAFIAAPEARSEANSTSSFLTFALAALGTFLVVISFAVKRKFLQRSVDRQDVSLVQKGLVIAWAICEVSALIGLLERFLIGNRDYFILFLLAAVGIALHFPRPDYLKSASYKTPSTGGL